MRTLKNIFLLIIAAVMLASCEKDDTGSGTPIDIDRPLTGQATVIGIVYDTSGEPMAGVNVSCGNATGITNAKGKFQLEDAPEGKDMVVDFELAGYMTTQKTIETKKDTERLVYAAMTQVGKTTKVDAAAGGMAEHAGMSVDFPANAFVKADGSAFTGEAEVEITFVPVTTGEFVNVFPGDFSGLREDGTRSYIESYGFADVNISANGEELNLANGVEATLTYPVAAKQQSEAPATIPLWYYDFDKGSWIEDGAATLVGTEYVGSVSHFTPWNVDKPVDISDLNGRVVDGEGNPLANAYVRCESQSDRAWVFTTYSDENGNFSTPVEANEQIKAVAHHSAVQSQVETATSGAVGTSTTVNDLIIDLSELEAGWELIDVGVTEDFSDVFFLDCNTGWAVTSGMSRSSNEPTLNVVGTTDGGETWDVSVELTGGWKYESTKSVIRFRDANFGVITSMFGHFYSEDGGKTWISFDAGGDDFIGYIVDNVTFGPGNRINLYNSQGISYTTDLGNTWTLKQIDGLTNTTEEQGNYLRSHLVDDENVFIFVGEGWQNERTDFTIFRSNDYGLNWTNEDITNNPFSIPNHWAGRDSTFGHGLPMHSPDNDNHYALDNSGLYYSIDKMSTWNNSVSQVPQGATALNVVDADNIYIGTGFGGLYSLESDGSWKQYLNSGGSAILDIHMCDPENGIAVGGNGTLLRLAQKEWLEL